MQVADDPALILVDTPGIMLPRLKESAFAWRAALLGLIPDGRVSLPSLFAFTLFVLAQEPNLTELKATLSTEVLPIDSERRGGQRHERGVRLQDAFSARRVAKQALQAIASVSQLRVEAEQHRLNEVNAGAEVQRAGGRPQRFLGQQDAALAGPNPARPASALAPGSSAGAHELESRDGAPLGQRGAAPKTAADMLALMQADAPPVACGRQSAQQPAVPVGSSIRDLAVWEPQPGSASTHAAVGAARDRDGDAQRSEASPRQRKRPPGVWEPFHAGVWQACAGDMLDRMLAAGAGHAPTYDARCNDAMQRVVRLVRAGALGALLFEGMPADAPAASAPARASGHMSRTRAPRPRPAPAYL